MYDVGTRFGNWTIIEYPYKSRNVLARCDCGRESWVSLGNLIGRASSGCRDCYLGGRSTTPEHQTFRSVLATARRRGIRFDLSFDEWMEISQRDCEYCGCPPQNMITSLGFRYNGLDRVDSDGIYEVSNVVPCCRLCNRAKSDIPLDEFIDWIRMVYGKTATLQK